MDTSKIIYSVIGIVVLCLVVAALLPTLNTGVDTIHNVTGAPLGGLFTKNGVIVLLFMAGVVIAIVAGFTSKKH